MPANDRQVGGEHYRRFAIQAWDIIRMYGLGYFDGHAVKYILRARHKGGVEDLKKAIHFLEKLVEEEEAFAAAQRPANPDDR